MVYPRRPLIWPPILEALRAKLDLSQEIYLVGGAVRDAYLGRSVHDIDLATPGDGRPLARQIANAFGGAYYPLDAERGVGRAIIPTEQGPLPVDVAQFRGPDLLTDLQKRDFTLNALAVDLRGDLQAVIDPMGGLDDLYDKRLRRCGPSSIADDPLRSLRGVRASVTFTLRIERDTIQDIKANAGRLQQVSPERVRDEFFQILGGRRPAAGLETLRRLGLLAHLIPEAAVLDGTTQSPPHQFDVWRHTLLTIERLDSILHEISPRHDDNVTANAQVGLVSWTLELYRDAIRQHINQQWPNGRSHRALLIFAALLHDIAKPQVRSVDESGRIRFFEHEVLGESIAQERGEALRLSNGEVERLCLIVRNHMRPHHLSSVPQVTARAMYRFWRDTGPAGLDICLLALADYLGTSGPALNTQDWIHYLERIQRLLDFYYTRHLPIVSQSPLLTGQILMERFGLEPGRQLGSILNEVREAQAANEINTQEEALDWVQRFLDNQ